MLKVFGGGKTKKNKNGKRMRGGSDLMPAIFRGSDGAPTDSANYANKVVSNYASNQVGGSYGFTDGGDSNTYGGSYAPWSRNCTSGAIVSRGGNDVMSGGRRRKARKTKKGSKKGGARKSRKTKKGGKKYRQRGCSKNKRGGNVILM